MQLTRRQFSGWLTAACLASQLRQTDLAARELSVDKKMMATSFTHANNAFAFTLLKQLTDAQPAANQFLSPFSLESALTIALEGARGQTAAQMGSTLQYPQSLKRDGNEPWDMSTLRTQYADLINGLKPPNDETANKTRRELAELKQRLDKLNAKSRELANQRKYSESAKVGLESQPLADRINQLSQTVDQFELATANSLWVDKTYGLSKVYQQTIKNYYGSAEANACDFVNKADAERVRINDWVSENTRNKIKNIIPDGGLSPETRLVIANAIYFKGNWAKPFASARTAPAKFTRSNGTTTDVSMMFAPALDVARYAAFNNDGSAFATPEMVDQSFENSRGYPSDDGYQVVELPYAGDRLSMVLLLPRSKDSLNKLLGSLTAEKFAACRSALKTRDVHVKLPKFKLETTYNLIPDLKALGMPDAFSPERADFSGLSESKSLAERLYISLVIHKAFVEVNEKGTEAAAATVVGMARASAPIQRPFTPEFTADRPFLAAIVDTTTDAILFLGKVEAV